MRTFLIATLALIASAITAVAQAETVSYKGSYKDMPAGLTAPIQQVFALAGVVEIPRYCILNVESKSKELSGFMLCSNGLYANMTMVSTASASKDEFCTTPKLTFFHPMNGQRTHHTCNGNYKFAVHKVSIQWQKKRET